MDVVCTVVFKNASSKKGVMSPTAGMFELVRLSNKAVN
jgi:hypothetical protein